MGLFSETNRLTTERLKELVSKGAIQEKKPEKINVDKILQVLKKRSKYNFKPLTHRFFYTTDRLELVGIGDGKYQILSLGQTEDVGLEEDSDYEEVGQDTDDPDYKETQSSKRGTKFFGRKAFYDKTKEDAQTSGTSDSSSSGNLSLSKKDILKRELPDIPKQSAQKPIAFPSLDVLPKDALSASEEGGYEELNDLQEKLSSKISYSKNKPVLPPWNLEKDSPYDFGSGVTDSEYEKPVVSEQSQTTEKDAEDVIEAERESKPTTSEFNGTS